ncbi:Cytochrome c, mono-and diheme variants [Cupriavidus sp. YR651]|uniref:c-type cytochrome n=1 Tax=Cupriavidus sp. YR651 TaxID=1855315 RepID=UPI000888F427|nr:cytochrome c [Cupriavidus sp. YR651]SDD97884.1 Cytochrome c, mono-and diheme variants [Cupriavidus sp. YR651]
MNPESRPRPNSQMREYGDPSERLQPIPRLAALVTAAVITIGVAYVFFSDPFGSYALGDRRTLADLAAKPAATDGAETVDGKALFTANCAACHQDAGTGVPGVFPPLDGSEWVNADSRIVINILLHGIEGEIKVKDIAYKGTMPSFAKFSDAEVAAVATYIRSQWSNKADSVSVDQVVGARKAAVRTTPFTTGAELQALAAKP